MAKTPLPNLIRCRNISCGWEEDLDPDRHELPMSCPECDQRTQVRCGAKLAKKDHRCRCMARPGGRCRRHGKLAPKGPAAGRFVDGSHSKYNPARRVPNRYVNSYDAAFNDPLAQREMRHQLSLMAGMEDEAAARLETRESGEAWIQLEAAGKRVTQTLRRMKRLRALGEDRRAAEQAAEAVLVIVEDEILPVIEQGAGEESARRELMRLFDKRAKLIRVQQQGEDSVSTAILATFQAFFAGLISKHVTDTRALSLMLAELREAELPGYEAAGLTEYRKRLTGRNGNADGEGGVIDA